MLLYISSTLSGSHGLGQSGLDVLVALLESGHPTLVCTKDSTKFTNDLCKFTSLTPDIARLEGNLKLPKKVGRYFVKILIQRVKQKIFTENVNQKFLTKISSCSPKLVIVNSIGSHDFWIKVKQEIPDFHKSVLIVRESPRHFHASTKLSLSKVIQTLQQYDYLIFVSKNCQNEWLELAKLNPNRLFYLPNCCREDLVAKIKSKSRVSLRKKLNLSPGKLTISCVASLQPRKGQDILVNVFPSIISMVPDVKLYLIGPVNSIHHGQWFDSLSNKISSEKLCKNIKYLGPKKNSLEYIYASDFVILPSRAEAMPRVILEAMALGTPIIASDVDGVSELIENRKSGLLFASENHEELISAFDFAVNYPKEIEKMTQIAEKRYWEKFSRLKQISRYRHVIDQMLDQENLC